MMSGCMDRYVNEAPAPGSCACSSEPTPTAVAESTDQVRRTSTARWDRWSAAPCGDVGLRWHNVHLDTGRLSFCAGWVEGPDGPVLAATTTKRSHVVDLDPATWAVLADYAATDSTDPRHPDGFVFSVDQGITAWKPNRVTKAFLRHGWPPRVGRW